MNIDILGISEIKWTGMDKFNSDGRGWWWEKLGLSLVGRALLSKALIQLSADGWGFTLSLLAVWPEATQS